MTLPDMPAPGSRELIEAWESIVVADAISWREEPGDVTLEFLRESVDKLLAAQKAYQEAKEQPSERPPDTTVGVR